MLNTIGYEGAAPSDFMRTLVEAGIDIVVDIRDRAQSRRAGFSKSALSASLDERGIRYVHLRELGDPKEGREAARSNDLVKFQKIYSQVLATEVAQAAVGQIAQALQNSSVCLLCYERDALACHRKLVADNITRLTGIKVRHLGVRTLEQDDRVRR